MKMGAVLIVEWPPLTSASVLPHFELKRAVIALNSSSTKTCHDALCIGSSRSLCLGGSTTRSYLASSETRYQD